MKGLTTGQDVYVITPAGAPISAKIESVQGKNLVLALAAGNRAEDGDPVAAVVGKTVQVQFLNRRGVCRIDGVVRNSNRFVRAVQFESIGDMRVIQRREFVRVDASIPVEYEPIGPEDWKVTTTTGNVSGGGFLLNNPQALKVGETMRFTLDLGQGEGYVGGPLEVMGKAVRETEGGALGINFEDISDEDRERVIRFVFARERMARAVTRDG
jgi:c-di-GMP-binding flagellar brake protein YcgR